MTNKQIIVDGIDVSECVYYFDKKCRCMDASIMQDFYLCPQCNSNPNCYYKKFKRSEAQCEGMFVTHTDLEMKYKAKEQECEWLHLWLPIVTRIAKQFGSPKRAESIGYLAYAEQIFAELDQLKGVIKKYEECNKYLVEENGKTYTRLEYKLLKTLTEIKEVLQFYNNSTIGVDKGNGIFELEVSNDNFGKLICCYDTNPAKKALQRISEVMPDEN